MKQWVASEWEKQRHSLILWCPVFFASGIYLYFALPFEPRLTLIIALAIAGLVLVAVAVLMRGNAKTIAIALIFLTSGYISATFRSYSVSAPILEFRYYGPVEGRIIKVDKSSSDAQRILLDRVVMTELRHIKTPERVRVSLFGDVPNGTLVPGARVTMVANMSPPGTPAEPGGFDFRIMAWFDRIGAVGYTRNPVLEMRPYDDDGLWLDRFRVRVATYVYDSIGGQNGAFAGAILTGDRSRIDPAVLDQLRASNLAHLLAISGLHMGLLTGFVYLIIRYGLALWPRAALALPTKKVGAFVALLIGLGYLFISGGNVATQRAFIMVAVVLIAVMLDRPAFTLRAVALAAMIVLAARPESLNEAGFQMSFAATTALIGVFDWLRKLTWWREGRHGKFARLMPFVALVITSGVAGLATAPISAFHFNQLSNFGLLANILSVPVMGLMVMPAAVVAGILSIFGWADPAFWVMGQGVGWILAVAEHFAMLPNATTAVKSATSIVLPMVAIAGCILFLVKGISRGLSVALFAGAMVIWQQTPRPHLLINENGSLIGVLTNDGRVLNKESAYRFAASSWLENDGDLAAQAESFSRHGLLYEGTKTMALLPGNWRVILERSRPYDHICNSNEIFIAPKWPEAPSGDCNFIGQGGFEAGAISVSIVGGQPEIKMAAPRTRLRPWNNGGRFNQ